MPIPEHMEEQIVVGMYDRGLLGFPERGVTLKSGRRSPYYYDSRKALSISKKLAALDLMPVTRQLEFRRDLIGAVALNFGEINRQYDHVFGKAEAATTLSGNAAVQAGLSYLWERTKIKSYGIDRLKVQGDYEPGEAVLIADNALTTGQSIIEGGHSLQRVELQPAAAAVEFDRQEGGLERLENYGLEVKALTNISKAAPFLVDNSRIGSKELDRLAGYHEMIIADGLSSGFIYPKGV